MEIKVEDIIKICNGKLICGNDQTVCENFSIDTRKLDIGDVYIGIKGENFDGNTLYKQALEIGANVCILQDVQIDVDVLNKYKNKAIIIVDDTLKALQKIATYKRSLYDIPVVAVTGSVGKTSTKDMIASVMSKEYNVQKTQGNYNNHIGLPLTILGLKNHTALVVEMGMNNLGEISVLTNIAKPNICVITNVGTSHIGNLGSRENILKAKLEILEGMTKDGTLVINNDNDLLHNWYIKNDTYKVETFGIENESDIIAENIKLEEFNSEFIVKLEKEKQKIKVPVGGKHFVYNAICAVAVGKVLNISNEKVVKGIEEFKLTKNRMDIKENQDGVTIINDCYNANYDSMKEAIKYLSKINANKKIAVLGDMLELGEYSKQLHEKVGEEIIKNNIDVLITVGVESKNIINKAKQLGKLKDVYNYSTNIEAITKIKEIAKPKDVILIKASNGMHFIEIVNSLI